MTCCLPILDGQPWAARSCRRRLSRLVVLLRRHYNKIYKNMIAPAKPEIQQRFSRTAESAAGTGGVAMKNRVTVTIAGQEYTLVATEDQGYVEKVAQHVDAQMKQVLEGARVSLVDGAVLTAVNIADEYFKEVEASENLRRQLKEYLEEATKLKMELSEAKREIFKLQNQKKQ